MGYAAGIDPDIWKQLANKYDLNYAVIDYNAITLKDSIPYSKLKKIGFNTILKKLDNPA